ncbi:DNA-3-methyladenine glycosylase family protein [Parasediminibacterium sp. JCM 36343]|uniref:DNA-3-methyladenine glycosylase family protein n=1 Tax=Parasediminibacterium sp. JCM 36343 TaxID=3374279 RepID=UPI00397A4F8A
MYKYFFVSKVYLQPMEYTAHLQKDKKLATILGTATHQLVLHQNIPLRLIASIMSQQLNTKVASIIFKRFLALYNGAEPTPQQVIDTPFEKLRVIGLSNNKVKYVQNVAAFCLENKITDTLLLGMENYEIIKLLTQIKGVGQWTVEMLLLFSLGREDVFAVDDLGIQQAIQQLYGLDASDKKKLKADMLQLSAQWKPYRSYACLHLWRWKDNIN